MATVKIDDDTLSEVVRQHLTESLDIIESLAQPEDTQLWLAMKEVIEYYSTPSQIEDFNSRTTHPNWEEMVLNEIGGES